jgi:hypothetical protein
LQLSFREIVASFELIRFGHVASDECVRRILNHCDFELFAARGNVALPDQGQREPKMRQRRSRIQLDRSMKRLGSSSAIGEAEVRKAKHGVSMSKVWVDLDRSRGGGHAGCEVTICELDLGYARPSDGARRCEVDRATQGSLGRSEVAACLLDIGES